MKEELKNTQEIFGWKVVFRREEVEGKLERDREAEEVEEGLKDSKKWMKARLKENGRGEEERRTEGIWKRRG